MLTWSLSSIKVNHPLDIIYTYFTELFYFILNIDCGETFVLLSIRLLLKEWNGLDHCNYIWYGTLLGPSIAIETVFRVVLLGAASTVLYAYIWVRQVSENLKNRFSSSLFTVCSVYSEYLRYNSENSTLNAFLHFPKILPYRTSSNTRLMLQIPEP